MLSGGTFTGKVLHVGCGGAPLPPWLDGLDETRLDIDEQHAPDIVANMCDLGEIGTYDVIFSSHSLEHLTPSKARKALAEFLRVLNPGGKCIVMVPDTEGVIPTNEPLFTSPAGPITGHDLFYGAGWLVDQNPYMEHKSAWTKDTLSEAMLEAGFAGAAGNRGDYYNLIVIGVKGA